MGRDLWWCWGGRGPVGRRGIVLKGSPETFGWDRPRKRPNPYTFSVSNTGCFEVDFNYTPRNRYPVFQSREKPTTVHRHVWEECFGFVPEGMCVCHKCDNPKCINPEHLFLGTHKDNMADKHEKNRCPVGEDSGRSKLTEEAVRSIRSSYKPYDPIWGRLALSRQYGVDVTTIEDVVLGNHWRHVL